MKVAELKAILERYNDDDEIRYAQYSYDHCERYKVYDINEVGRCSIEYSDYHNCEILSDDEDIEEKCIIIM